MASISKRPDGRWRARYRDANGKEHAKHFNRKIDGQRWLDEVTTAVVTGQYVHPMAGRITVEQYASQVWLPSLSLRASSRREYEGALSRHLVPALGSMPMSSVRPVDARALLMRLEDRLSPRTARRIYSHARSLFRHAVIGRVVPVSPFEGVRGLPLPGQRRSIPNIEDVRSVVAAADPLTAVMVLVAAQTGMRSAELRGLTTAALDLDRRRLRVDQQLVTETGGRWSLGEPKTAAGVRVVRFGAGLQSTLQTFLAVNPPSAQGLLFHEEGRPVANSTWDYRVKAAQRRARVAPFRIHDLRHHCASVLIAAGVPVPAITEQLGHASAQVTFTTYAHLLRDDEEAAADAMSIAWAQSPAD